MYEPKLLARLGKVVDLSGRDPGGAAQALAEAGIAGVVTFSDEPLVLAAQAAEALGLVHNSVATAERLSSKLAQRLALWRAGVPSPAFTRAPAGVADHERQLRLASLNYPVVLKPDHGSGSMDTFLAATAAELGALLSALPSKGFCIEEYIPDRPTPLSGTGADIISVESLAQDGRTIHLATSGRFPFAPPLRETGIFMPADLASDAAQAACDLVTDAVRALEVKWGLLHTEVKFSPSGPQVIEVNGRLGGRIGDLVSQLDGPPLLSWALRLALGDTSPVPPLQPDGVAYYRLVVAPMEANEVRAIQDIDDVLALEGVGTVTVNRQPGDKLDYRDGGPAGHVLLYSGLSPDHAALRRVWRQADLILSGGITYR